MIYLSPNAVTGAAEEPRAETGKLGGETDKAGGSEGVEDSIEGGRDPRAPGEGATEYERDNVKKADERGAGAAE